MKNSILLLSLFAVVISSSAQDTKHDLAFKGYAAFIKSNNLSGNTSFYDFSNFQIGFPSLALSITSGKRNYHQIELSDLKLDISDGSSYPGESTQFSIGFRYSYNISLVNSQNGKLKIFIAPGAHLLTNYFNFPEGGGRYTTINAELNVAPVISYSFNQHFSIEANVPLTFFGFTEEMYPYDNGGPWRQDNPYFGSQYFYGRIGLAYNL